MLRFRNVFRADVGSRSTVLQQTPSSPLSDSPPWRKQRSEVWGCHKLTWHDFLEYSRIYGLTHVFSSSGPVTWPKRFRNLGHCRQKMAGQGHWFQLLFYQRTSYVTYHWLVLPVLGFPAQVSTRDWKNNKKNIRDSLLANNRTKNVISWSLPHSWATRSLTLALLTWTIWWAPTNAGERRLRFNL